MYSTVSGGARIDCPPELYDALSAVFERVHDRPQVRTQTYNITEYDTTIFNTMITSRNTMITPHNVISWSGGPVVAHRTVSM
jgi:hypothetical protein